MCLYHNKIVGKKIKKKTVHEPVGHLDIRVLFKIVKRIFCGKLFPTHCRPLASRFKP